MPPRGPEHADFAPEPSAPLTSSPRPQGGPALGEAREAPEGKTHLIHCSYHKCLTVYFGRVLGGIFNRCLPWSAGYRHFNSHLEDFLAAFPTLRVASVNNRALELERLGRYRLSRFIRDPRDLVVSGYFYHRRGAEAWTRIDSPTEHDWAFANGRIPDELRARGGSFAEYLSAAPSRRVSWPSSSSVAHTSSRWRAGRPSIPTS